LPLTLTILAACGGPPQDSRSEQPVGFVNHTIHSDAQLRAIWTRAQKNLAQQVDLNPLERQNSPNVAAKIKPGDPRALIEMPHQLVVDNEVDVSSETLHRNWSAEA
jgi:hypothetical protein